MYDTKSCWFFNQCLLLISAKYSVTLWWCRMTSLFIRPDSRKQGTSLVGINSWCTFLWHIKPISMKHPFGWPTRFNLRKNIVLDDVLPTGLPLSGARNLSTQEYINVCWDYLGITRQDDMLSTQGLTTKRHWIIRNLCKINLPIRWHKAPCADTNLVVQTLVDPLC